MTPVPSTYLPDDYVFLFRPESEIKTLGLLILGLREEQGIRSPDLLMSPTLP